MNGSPLKRVRKGSPCPICQSIKWCSVSEDGAIALCGRVAEGSYKKCKNGAYLHFLKPADSTPRPRIRSVSINVRPDSRLDLQTFADKCRTNVNPDRLTAFAEAMGLSVDSLKQLRVGWALRDALKAMGTGCRSFGCWTFPMLSASGDVLGVRLRGVDGYKFSVTGGNEGLFVPDGLRCGEQLLIAEGPTDTAALLDMGLNALGRPSCKGGVRLLVELLRAITPSSVVIVADPDIVGIEGARLLALALSPYVIDLRCIAPPKGVKDIREWKKRGATAVDIEMLIDAADRIGVEVVSE